VWCRHLPEFTYDFTGFEPVEKSEDKFSSLVQESGLDKAKSEDVTELLDSHGQQLANENLGKPAKELSYQKEENKKMKTLL
jgi:hypothetical protein